jgi:protein TonB
MFETAAISYGSAGKRLWTACLGMTGQTALVGLAILIPMLHPSVLPRPQALMTWLEAPLPPPPPPAQDGPAVVRAKPRPSQIVNGDILTLPRHIPARAIMIEDPPAETTGAGSGPGVVGSMGTAAPGSLLDRFIASVAEVAVIPRPVERAPAAAPAPVPAAPIRIRVSVVEPGLLVHRVEPVYPDLARRARISGEVKLEGVIGTDGRIRELKALSGNPLLSRAALDAVSQWLYRPTTLNGDPVEVIAPITVTFRLN